MGIVHVRSDQCKSWGKMRQRFCFVILAECVTAWSFHDCTSSDSSSSSVLVHFSIIFTVSLYFHWFSLQVISWSSIEGDSLKDVDAATCARNNLLKCLKKNVQLEKNFKKLRNSLQAQKVCIFSFFFLLVVVLVIVFFLLLLFFFFFFSVVAIVVFCLLVSLLPSHISYNGIIHNLYTEKFYFLNMGFCFC